MTLSETEIIKRFFQKDFDNDRSLATHTQGVVSKTDVLIGIGDDAAAVRLPAGMQLLASIDTVVEGVHFPNGFDAADIGYRVLAVNLSDLAAMAAQPAWALLSLSLPTVDEKWLEAFCEGFFQIAENHGVTLIGGDLVQGPLAATVSIMGYCPEGAAIRRIGAAQGDGIYVTGSPGAAAIGLQSLMDPDQKNLRYEACFRRPRPRVNEGIALRGIASAMIDVSDGLLQDVGRIAAASRVRVNLDAQAIAQIATGGLNSALCGGDDYELCFTVPENKQGELAAITEQWECKSHRIGQIESGHGCVMPGHNLSSFLAFDHFAGKSV